MPNKVNDHGGFDDIVDSTVVDEFARWRAANGFVDHNAKKGPGAKKVRGKLRGQKKKIHTINLTEDAWLGLLYLAKEHGITYYGDPNVSGFIEAIGNYKLLVLDKSGHSKLPEIGPNGIVTDA